MDDRKAELLNKIEKVVELKTDIDILEANIETLKVEIIKGMAELGVKHLTHLMQEQVLWILKEAHLIRN